MIGVKEIISTYMMKKIEKHAIEKLGIPENILMENAGFAAFNILEKFPYKYYTIVCAPGNNGGDGLVLARHLFANGKFVYLNIVGDMQKQTENFKNNFEILKKMGLAHRIIKNEEVDLQILKGQIERSDVVVDAIFGIGLNKDVEGLFSKTIDTINELSKYTVSLDIPSGLEADNGMVLGNCIKANKTITFYKAKNALVNEKQYSGDIEVVNIGIPYDIFLED